MKNNEFKIPDSGINEIVNSIKTNRVRNDVGMSEIINTRAEKLEKLKEILSSLEYRFEIYDEKEMNEVIKLNQKLMAVEHEDKLQRKQTSNPEKVSEENFRKLVEYLDNLDLWAAKFTTDINNDSGVVIRSEEDSLYYMTESGISFRLKKVYLSKTGLKIFVSPQADGVIQLIHEKIYFVGDKGECSEQPVVGYSVFEASSPEFNSMIDSGKIHGDFVSKIKIYEKKNKIFYVEKPDHANSHDGHAVNYIYWNKFEKD